MKRVVIAGLLGGIVVFFWGAAAHTVLDIGAIGLRVAPDAAQEPVLETLREQLGGEGVYLLPMMQEEDWGDSDKAEAFAASTAHLPYAFVVFQPQNLDAMARFPLLLGRQAATDILAALLAAWVVSFAIAGFLQRLLIVVAMGVFAWLAISVPYWNWYRFPTDATGAVLIEQAVGWLLGGLVIAWLVKPRAAAVA